MYILAGAYYDPGTRLISHVRSINPLDFPIVPGSCYYVSMVTSVMQGIEWGEPELVHNVCKKIYACPATPPEP